MPIDNENGNDHYICTPASLHTCLLLTHHHTALHAALPLCALLQVYAKKAGYKLQSVVDVFTRMEFLVVDYTLTC